MVVRILEYLVPKCLETAIKCMPLQRYQVIVGRSPLENARKDPEKDCEEEG
jgi:hypothetical protein